MEDLLQRLLATQGTLWPEPADAMLKATDGLRAFVANLRKGITCVDSFGPLALELIRVQSPERSETAQKTPAPPAPPTANVTVPPAASEPSTEPIAPAHQTSTTVAATVARRFVCRRRRIRSRGAGHLGRSRDIPALPDARDVEGTTRLREAV
jgi:hypothetical protein